MVKCPRCGKRVPWESNPYRPFCSERCKLIDLGMWASEAYRIAESLKAKGVRVEAVEVVQHPQNTVALPPEEAQKVMRLVEALEDLDDVQHVYTNLDPESLQVEA